MTGVRQQTVERLARIKAAKAAGVDVADIAGQEGLSKARIYQLLGATRKPRDPHARPHPLALGGNKRPAGGSQSRFAGTAAHADRDAAALAPSHQAMREMTTMFRKSIVAAAETERILVSGVNSAKIGSTITKGPWRGLPIFTVTLVERATCPQTCHLLAECYGNAMPFARRHAYDDDFVTRLGGELTVKSVEHRRGFVVRLHVLGDFPDVAYVIRWGEWLHAMPNLRVFGYTAHPRESAIGRSISALNVFFAARWAIRFSVPPAEPAAKMQATTIWRAGATGRQPEGIVCPAQTHQTQACATCGLCWAPSARRQRIAFIGHGMRGGRTAGAASERLETAPQDPAHASAVRSPDRHAPALAGPTPRRD